MFFDILGKVATSWEPGGEGHDLRCHLGGSEYHLLAPLVIVSLAPIPLPASLKRTAGRSLLGLRQPSTLFGNKPGREQFVRPMPIYPCYGLVQHVTFSSLLDSLQTISGQ